jgi:hypothetical protein
LIPFEDIKAVQSKHRQDPDDEASDTAQVIDERDREISYADDLDDIIPDPCTVRDVIRYALNRLTTGTP